MVRVTIYVEGGVPHSDEGGIDNSAVFRENFHRLFAQILTYDSFDLAIQPIGQISQAAKYLEKISGQKINGILLVDLDGPKSSKTERVQNNYPTDPSKVFFMIQEMEAWILSQPEKIEDYAKTIQLIFTRTESIGNNPLIKNIHPEAIQKPGDRLNTIFRQHFSSEKMRKGKIKQGPKNYIKSKDGPALIGLLDLTHLVEVFDEVQRLIEYIRRF